MKKTILLTLTLCALPSLAMAADFSGTWVRDAKSDPQGYPIYWTPRQAPAPGRGGNGEVTIDIKQTGDKLQITTPQAPLRTYILDGKPHMVTLDTGIQKVSMTATASGNAVNIDSVQPYGSMPGNVGTKVNENWTLSPDGKSLTLIVTRNLPARVETIKEYYTKK
jgi:hypothetical protein